MEGLENYQVFTEDMLWDGMKTGVGALFQILLEPKVFFPLLAVILMAIGYRILTEKLRKKKKSHGKSSQGSQYSRGFKDGFQAGQETNTKLHQK